MTYYFFKDTGIRVTYVNIHNLKNTKAIFIVFKKITNCFKLHIVIKLLNKIYHPTAPLNVNVLKIVRFYTLSVSERSL